MWWAVKNRTASASATCTAGSAVSSPRGVVSGCFGSNGTFHQLFGGAMEPSGRVRGRPRFW